MPFEIQKDIGEEIIIKLKELENKIKLLLKIKNEKEFPDPPVPRH